VKACLVWQSHDRHGDARNKQADDQRANDPLQKRDEVEPICALALQLLGTWNNQERGPDGNQDQPIDKYQVDQVEDLNSQRPKAKALGLAPHTLAGGDAEWTP